MNKTEIRRNRRYRILFLLFSYSSYRFETSQTMIPMGMAIQVIKNQKANNESVTGYSSMYITVPIHNQKNKRVIFYFAIGHSLEDHT